jgi:hypothetical protein
VRRAARVHCGWIAVLVAGALAGCGDTTRSEQESDSLIDRLLRTQDEAGEVSSPGPIPNGQLYSCYGSPFSHDVFDQSPGVEREDSPWAEALREQIKYDRRPELRFRNEWRALARNDKTVEFAKGQPPHLSWVRVEREARGAWGFSGSGGCTPRAFRKQTDTAGWIVDPAAHTPSRESTEIPVVVNDFQCANGRSPRDRLLEPRIEYGEDAITIIYWTQLVGTATCPGHPPTHATLTLAEPLDDRALVDGGTLPAKPRFPDRVYDYDDRISFGEE